MLNHWDVEIFNINPLIASPLKNSNVNLTMLYKIQYKPTVLYVPINFLYVKIINTNINKLQTLSIICEGNNGTLFGA